MSFAGAITSEFVVFMKASPERWEKMPDNEKKSNTLFLDRNKEMFAEAKKMKNNKQFAALVFKIAKEEAEKEGVVWNAEKRSFETPIKEETK